MGRGEVDGRWRACGGWRHLVVVFVWCVVLFIFLRARGQNEMSSQPAPQLPHIEWCACVYVLVGVRLEGGMLVGGMMHEQKHAIMCVGRQQWQCRRARVTLYLKAHSEGT